MSGGQAQPQPQPLLVWRVRSIFRGLSAVNVIYLAVIHATHANNKGAYPLTPLCKATLAYAALALSALGSVLTTKELSSAIFPSRNR